MEMSEVFSIQVNRDQGCFRAPWLFKIYMNVELRMMLPSVHIHWKSEYVSIKIEESLRGKKTWKEYVDEMKHLRGKWSLRVEKKGKEVED